MWERVFAWLTEQKTLKNRTLDLNGWNVSTTQTSATSRNTHSTGFTAACISYIATTGNMANPQVPEPVITNTEDGMVRITVGDEKGWVSSYHLVEPKVNQLIQTWLFKHNKS